MLTNLQTYVLCLDPHGLVLAHWVAPVCTSELCNVIWWLSNKNDLIFALMQNKEGQIRIGENVRWVGRDQRTAKALGTVYTWRTVYTCAIQQLCVHDQFPTNNDIFFEISVLKTMFLFKLGGRSSNNLHTYIHDHHCSKVIGQQLQCASGHRPITHVEQIKWPMADFHLGQHLLFRKHAYTVTCHLAPGALWRPTLPLRDGPPFCSVLKMISMHEISWGAHKLFPLLCIPVWIFPRLVSVKVCERVQTVRAWCQAEFVRLHILVRAHF